MFQHVTYTAEEMRETVQRMMAGEKAAFLSFITGILSTSMGDMVCDMKMGKHYMCNVAEHDHVGNYDKDDSFSNHGLMSPSFSSPFLQDEEYAH